MVARQVVDDSLFDVTKALLTFPFEVLPDRAAELLLDHVIGIDERLTQAAGQLPSDSGLARTGQADKGNHSRRFGPAGAAGPSPINTFPNLGNSARNSVHAEA